MKSGSERTRKRFLIALFFVLFAALATAAIAVLSAVRKDYGGNVTAVRADELITLKVGERLKLSEAIEEFAELEEKLDGTDYSVRSQTGGRVFLDERGYISASEPGYYSMEVRMGVADAGVLPYAYRFSADVAVYPADEADCIPFEGSLYDSMGCYILTSDIALDADESRWLYDGSFYGVLINPHGYTITVTDVPALFQSNYGILDGVKVRFRGRSDDFIVFADTNNGAIRGRTAEGEMTVGEEGAVADEYDGPTVSLLCARENSGWIVDNTVRMSVATDLPLDRLSYDPHASGNELYIDARHLADFAGSTRRNVVWANASTAEEMEARGNFIADAEGNRADSRLTHPVRVRSPWYNETMSVPDGGWAELPAEVFQNPSPLLGESGRETEVKYWTVNGIRYENLDNIRVSDEVIAEPCVKYIRTDYGSGAMTALANADETLVLGAELLGKNGFPTDIFDGFADDPFEVMPEKIVIEKEAEPDGRISGNDFCPVFTEEGRLFLRDFLRAGGEFEIEDAHPSLLFMENCLYTADGRTLICAFDEEGQTSFEAHPMVRTVEYHVFLPDNEIRIFDFSHAELFNDNAFADCRAAEEFTFGAVCDVPQGNLYSLLSPLQNVRRVNIDAANPDYFVENNCVVSAVGALVYIPRAIGGKIVVPDGTVQTGENPVFGEEVTEIVFPDSLAEFNERCIGYCRKLQTISFGSPDTLRIKYSESEDGYSPGTIGEISFGDIRVLSCTANAFRNENFGIVRLPDTLEEIEGIFTACSAFEVGEDNPYFATEDGVLYDRWKSRLIAWPARSEAESFKAPDSVTEIGDNAFYDSSVRALEFSSRLSGIGTSAFEDCKGLTSFRAPEADVRVGASAFAGCTSLSVFDGRIALAAVNAFSETALTEVVFSEPPDGLGQHAFENCMALESVVLPEGYEGEIPAYCFAGCTELRRIDLGGTTSVDDFAFFGCRRLHQAELPSVQSIGERAFSGSALNVLSLPALTSVGKEAFAACAVLREVTFPNAVRVEEGAFSGCAGLLSAELAAGATVGASAFEGCALLSGFSSAISSAGERAFAGCAALKEISFLARSPMEGVSIAASAFDGCTSLSEVRADTPVVQIDSFAFSGCTALSEIHIENSEGEPVRGGIGTSAFSGAESLSAYLYVDAAFAWEGKVPEFITVYVPADVREELLSEWLIGQDQLLALPE